MKKYYVPFIIKKKKNVDSLYLSGIFDDRSFYVPKFKKIDIEVLYEKVLTYVIDWLGNYHGNICESRVFWKKLISFWLYSYVLTTYEKLDQLEQLRNKLPNAFLYSEVDEISIENILSKSVNVGIFEDAEYNEFAYAYLAKKFFGFDIKYNSKDIELPHATVVDKLNGIKSVIHYKKINHKYIKYLYSSLRKRNIKVLYYCVDTMRKTAFNLCHISNGAVMPLRDISVYYGDAIDEVSRKAFRENASIVFKDDVLAVRICDLLSVVLPKFLVEDFYKNYCKVSKEYKCYSTLKVIFSQTGFLSLNNNTLFSVYGGQRGVKLIGYQHGGNYEVCNDVGKFEDIIVDEYYLWGHTEGKNFKKAITHHGISYKLFRDLCFCGAESEIGGLFIGDSIHINSAWGYCNMSDIKKKIYIDRQLEFFRNVDKIALAQIFIREFYVEYGWNIKERLNQLGRDYCWADSLGENKSFYNVNMDDRNNDFLSWLCRAKLIIVDHLSTTWLEAIAIGKPLVLLLDKEYVDIIDKEMYYFQLLEEAGILFWNPKTAADCVNAIINDVEAWWNDPYRKEVIGIVRERYCGEIDITMNIDEWWYQEFKLHL